MTVQQKTPCGHSKTLRRDDGTISTPEGNIDMNSISRGRHKTLERGHDLHLPPIGGGDKTSYGDGNITPNKENDSRSTPIAYQQNSVRIPRYDGPTSLTRKGDLKTVKRDNTECVSTFITDQNRREER